MDVNHDGKIDYDEFIRAGYNRSKLINLKNLKIAFDSIDYNGDGFIDAQELKSAFSNGVMESLSSTHQIDMDEQYWQDLLQEVD